MTAPAAPSAPLANPNTAQKSTPGNNRWNCAVGSLGVRSDDPPSHSVGTGVVARNGEILDAARYRRTSPGTFFDIERFDNFDPFGTLGHLARLTINRARSVSGSLRRTP
jgi:hypothetical protein